MARGSNTTYYTVDRKPEDVNPNLNAAGCMAFVHNITSKQFIELYTDEKDLNKGLTLKDAERWVEIGNSLLFPATFSYTKPQQLYAIRITKFNNSSVSVREVKNQRERVQGTISSSMKGDILSVAIYRNDEKGNINGFAYCKVTESDVKNIPKGTGYNFRFEELVSEDGSSLQDLVQSEYDRIKEENLRKTLDHITIKLERKNYLSGWHFLAAVSFYRFLWSHFYINVVSSTLNMIDSGITPWMALSYAYATYGTSAYYGLSNQGMMFSDFDIVAERLRNNSINVSFTSDINVKSYDKKKLLEESYDKAGDKRKTCINNENSKNLTVGKKYITFTTPSDNLIKVLGDSGKYVIVKKTKFE